MFVLHEWEGQNSARTRCQNAHGAQDVPSRDATEQLCACVERSLRTCFHLVMETRFWHRITSKRPAASLTEQFRAGPWQQRLLSPLFNFISISPPLYLPSLLSSSHFNFGLLWAKYIVSAYKRASESPKQSSFVFTSSTVPSQGRYPLHRFKIYSTHFVSHTSLWL